MKLRVGDTVKITLGKDSGKTGKIEKIFPKKGSVLVTGINMYKKHLKSKDKNTPSSIIDITKPMLPSKMTLICPKCHLQTRVGYQGVGIKKTRICKKCNQPISSTSQSSSRKKT